MVELLDRLVSPGSTVRIGEADQLSTPRMQLRRHLVGGQCLRQPDFATVTPRKTAIPQYGHLFGNWMQIKMYFIFYYFNVLS